MDQPMINMTAEMTCLKNGLAPDFCFCSAYKSINYTRILSKQNIDYTELSL